MVLGTLNKKAPSAALTHAVRPVFILMTSTSSPVPFEIHFAWLHSLIRQLRGDSVDLTIAFGCFTLLAPLPTLCQTLWASLNSCAQLTLKFKLKDIERISIRRGGGGQCSGRPPKRQLDSAQTSRCASSSVIATKAV